MASVLFFNASSLDNLPSWKNKSNDSPDRRRHDCSRKKNDERHYRSASGSRAQWFKGSAFAPGQVAPDGGKMFAPDRMIKDSNAELSRSRSHGRQSTDPTTEPSSSRPKLDRKWQQSEKNADEEAFNGDSNESAGYSDELSDYNHGDPNLEQYLTEDQAENQAHNVKPTRHTQSLDASCPHKTKDFVARKRKLNKTVQYWRSAVPLDRVRSNARIARLKSLLQINVIRRYTLDAFKIRAMDDALLLPLYSRHKEAEYDASEMIPSGLKIMRLTDPSFSDTLSVEIWPCENAFCGIFGYNMVLPNQKHVIFAGTEADALAIYQSTGDQTPVLVVPQKKPAAYNQQIASLLEQFQSITMWTPQSQHENLLKLIKQCSGKPRCYIVTSLIEHRSPIEILNSGNIEVAETKIIEMIGKSKMISSHCDVETFNTLRRSIESNIVDAQEIDGIARWSRFKVLNPILKGFRLAELTILAGGTGCGKTTFLGEYSLDLCEQNVRTLWCSFELTNSKLAYMIARQYSRDDANALKEEIDHVYEKLSTLPMYFAKMESHTSIYTIEESFEYLLSTYDIRHVIVDDVQSLCMSANENKMGSAKKSGKSRRFLDSDQDIRGTDHLLLEILGFFNQMVKSKNVHVTLVLHTELVDSNHFISSAEGAELKAYQLADNVLVIKRRLMQAKVVHFEKYLEIWKNRFAGDLSLGNRLAMLFDPRTKCHRIVRKNY